MMIEVCLLLNAQFMVMQTNIELSHNYGGL